VDVVECEVEWAVWAAVAAALPDAAVRLVSGGMRSSAPQDRYRPKPIRTEPVLPPAARRPLMSRAHWP